MTFIENNMNTRKSNILKTFSNRSADCDALDRDFRSLVKSSAREMLGACFDWIFL